VGHRAVLVIHPLHGELSAQVDNTDPGYVRHGPYSVAVPNPSDIVQPCRPLSDTPEAIAAAALTNGFVDASRVVLENSPVNKRRKQQGLLPANIVLLRDAGDRLPDLPSLQLKFGMKFASVVEMPVERGIAILTGMREIVVPDLEGRPELDYPKQAHAALATLPDCDAEYIHLKGPDVFGHDGDARGKATSIEKIDRYFFGELLMAIDLDRLVIAVTADHSTPATLKAHSADPVPVLVRAPGLPSDGSQRFDEEVCTHGRLGTIVGQELLPKLVGLTRQ
jgi:2,3-bisphosphoglycerate-independent phosphoglycerate mutase